MAKKNTYKLPEEKRLAIIADRKAGMFAEDVAAKHEVGRTTVFRVMLELRKAEGTFIPRGARGPMGPRTVSDITRRPEENNRGPRVAVHPVLATEGKWSQLAEYAAAQGITTAKAQGTGRGAVMAAINLFNTSDPARAEIILADLWKRSARAENHRKALPGSTGQFNPQGMGEAIRRWCADQPGRFTRADVVNAFPTFNQGTIDAHLALTGKRGIIRSIGTTPHGGKIYEAVK